MTEEEFQMLQTGDIVRPMSGPHSYVVTGNYGGRVTAVRTVDMTNPPEWALIRKAKHEGRYP